MSGGGTGTTSFSSLSERAERERIVARLHVSNAEFHAARVAETFGILSVEYVHAESLVQHERAALLATYAQGLQAAADAAAGVPQERTS
jgi:hypothetical protein